MFAVFVSLFFSGILTALALGCGYFKHTSGEWAMTLNKYEYREDFESVLKSYRLWIERFVNSFSKTRIQNIKDRIFGLQIKASGEVLLGVITSPFLAYGVSNTLAMCFPEAAGWVRISGLRFSGVPCSGIIYDCACIFCIFNCVCCSEKNPGLSSYQTRRIQRLQTAWR